MTTVFKNDAFWFKAYENDRPKVLMMEKRAQILLVLREQKSLDSKSIQMKNCFKTHNSNSDGYISTVTLFLTNIPNRVMIVTF